MGRPDRRPGRGRQPGHLADDCDGPCARPAGTGKRVSRPGRVPVLAKLRVSRWLLSRRSGHAAVASRRHPYTRYQPAAG